MAENNIRNNVDNDYQERYEDDLNPNNGFSEGNQRKQRGAFWTCFLIGLLLILLSVGVALAVNVTRVDLLKQGVDTYVVSQGIISQADADAFVNDTLDYLTGIKTVWEPAITVGGFRVGIPETFKTHMATVKSWVDSAKVIMLAGAALVLLLLTSALIGVKRSRGSHFSTGGYYLGTAVPLALLIGVGLWGYFDFDGLWAWVHTAFIPDGIFSTMEPIMQLFPVELFSGYLQPIAVTFGLCTAAVFVLPLLLWPLSKLLTALFGRQPARGNSTTRRTTTRRTDK